MTDLFNYSYTALFALISFSFISSITPGPNNLMLLYSGARFGFKQTIPHWLGVNIGFMTLLVLCCLGVAVIFFQIPFAQTVLKILGCIYMIWLAYQLWQNGALPSDTALNAEHQDYAKPLTFSQAAMFQYVNPKAWIMGLAVPASFLPTTGSLIMNTAMAVIVFGLINLACITVWVQGGVTLRSLMHKPTIARVINLIIVLMTLEPLAKPHK